MKKALFVTYGGGHVNMIIPVVRWLRENASIEPIVLGLTTAGPALAQAGIPYIGYRDLVQPGDERALETGKRLVDEMGSSALISREESIAYMGLSFEDAAQRLGRAEVENRYRTIGRHVFLQLSILDRCIRKFGPSVVIATNSPKSEKAAILKARQYGIPSVCVLDLFGIGEIEERIGWPGYADKVCVISEGVKRKLMEYCRNPEDIEITGNPAFDRLGDPELPAAGAALRKARGWTSEKVFLLIRSNSKELNPVVDGAQARMLELMKTHRDWHLVVRPHPNEPDYRLPRHERVHLSDKSESLATILHAADAVGVIESTVGYEAALAGRPLLQLDMSPNVRYAPYAEMGMATAIRSFDALESALQGLFSGRFTPPSLPRPGEATANVARVIQRLARV